MLACTTGRRRLRWTACERDRNGDTALFVAGSNHAAWGCRRVRPCAVSLSLVSFLFPSRHPAPGASSRDFSSNHVRTPLPGLSPGTYHPGFAAQTDDVAHTLPYSYNAHGATPSHGTRAHFGVFLDWVRGHHAQNGFLRSFSRKILTCIAGRRPSVPFSASSAASCDAQPLSFHVLMD